MPRGRYDVAGRAEAFSCAPGPAGWRYVSDRLDLACDAAFRPVRFAVTTAGGLAVHGGGARLDDGTPVLEWTDVHGRPHTTRADAVLTGSPGSWLAALRAVAGPGTSPEQAELEALVVDLEGLSTGVLRQRHRFSRVAAQPYVATQQHAAPSDADGGDVLLEQWYVDDLAAGFRRVLHVIGDVVVYAENLPAAGEAVEVIELESPPSGSRHR